jgi:hypothetical protein
VVVITQDRKTVARRIVSPAVIQCRTPTLRHGTGIDPVDAEIDQIDLRRKTLHRAWEEFQRDATRQISDGSTNRNGNRNGSRNGNRTAATEQRQQ